MREGDNGARSQLTGLGHAGVTVSDLQRSLDFYVNGLGLVCASRRLVEDEYIRTIVQVSGTQAIEIAMLALPSGEVAVELLHYVVDGSSAEEEPSNTEPSEPGTGHLCLFVNDAQVAWTRALAAGGTARSPSLVGIESGIYTGGLGCYLKDPDGYHIELLQPPSAVPVGTDGGFGAT